MNSFHSPDAPAPPAPRRSRLRQLAGVAIVPALIGAFIGLGGFDLFLPDDPYAEAAEAAGRRMLALPGFEERFGDAEDAQEAFEAGAQVGVQGIPRLSDAQLDTWLAISREVIGEVGTADCASFVRGPGDDTDFIAIFKTLDVETFRRYLDLVVRAAELALEGSSGPAVSQADVDAAVGQLRGAIGPARLQELAAAFGEPAGASDAELCSALRETYRAIASLDREVRYTLNRMFLGVASSA